MEQDYHYDSDGGNESSDVDVGLDFGGDGEERIGPANRYIRDNEDLAYEILSTEDVSEHMLEFIKEFNSVVKIPHTTARLLLNHFRWDKEKLMERFFDSNQEKLFEEAQIASPYKKKEVPAMQSSSGMEECAICCLKMPSKMMSGLECGHRYCLSCWSEYISTKVVDEGTGQCITCAGYNCPVVVEDSQVMSLLKDPKVKLIYQHRISQSFVECNRQLRWCPFPDCKFVVKAPHADARRVQCKCQHVFCFSCGANWHGPVKCSLLKECVKKCDDDSETSNWISANTKECPKCRVIIEKDGGCNHMVCKNVACKSEFCWVCLGPWEPHGSLCVPNFEEEALTQVEEALIAKRTLQCSDYGFPLQPMDLRIMVKSYLDSEGRTVPMFSMNLPGPGWAQSFIKRHSEIRKRVSNDIKRSRASVGEAQLRDYHERLTIELQGIPPTHIFNYDETNIADNTSDSKFLYRRGVKYPDRVIDMSKSCVTMMLCGSADGTLLPPFIIYKSDNLYSSWIQGGPKGDPCCHFRCCKNGTQFYNTASGWMDANAFHKWFGELLLPHLQNLDGPKAVIGDNLSAHFSETVLKLAEDNDIKFICLPPNSTDKTLPLDVAFFGPMKKAWKHVLEEFKVENPSVSLVNKQVFPKQVNKLFKHPSFYPNIEKNLKSGFRATGIFPLDINNLLRRLGNTHTGTDATPILSRATSSTTSSSLVIEKSPDASSLSNAFVNYLEEKKFPKCFRGGRRGGRGAKIQAGTRIVSTISQDEAEVSGQSTFDVHPSTSKDLSAYAVRQNVKRKLNLLARRDNAESESTDMDTDPDSEEIYDVRPTRSRSGRVLTPMLTPAGTPSKVQKEIPSPSSGTPTAGNTSNKVKPTPTKKLKATAAISATDEGSCTSTITKSSALKVGSFVITKVYVSNSSDKH